MYSLKTFFSPWTATCLLSATRVKPLLMRWYHFFPSRREEASSCETLSLPLSPQNTSSHQLNVLKLPGLTSLFPKLPSFITKSSSHHVTLICASIPHINVLGISQSDRGQGTFLHHQKQDDHSYQSGNQKNLRHRDLWQ